MYFFASQQWFTLTRIFFLKKKKGKEIVVYLDIPRGRRQGSLFGVPEMHVQCSWVHLISNALCSILNVFPWCVFSTYKCEKFLINTYMLCRMFPLFPPPPFIVSFEMVNRNQNVALELEYWAEKCTHNNGTINFWHKVFLFSYFDITAVIVVCTAITDLPSFNCLFPAESTC